MLSALSSLHIQLQGDFVVTVAYALKPGTWVRQVMRRLLHLLSQDLLVLLRQHDTFAAHICHVHLLSKLFAE